MKPFLLLGIRAEDVAADEEYAAMMRCTGLGEGELQRIRMEQRPLGSLDLDKWSGIILGGGPFQVSDPDETESATQLRVEAELADLLDDVVEHDHPFLGSATGSEPSAATRVPSSTGRTANRSAASRSR